MHVYWMLSPLLEYIAQRPITSSRYINLNLGGVAILEGGFEKWVCIDLQFRCTRSHIWWSISLVRWALGFFDICRTLAPCSPFKLINIYPCIDIPIYTVVSNIWGLDSSFLVDFFQQSPILTPVWSSMKLSKLITKFSLAFTPSLVTISVSGILARVLSLRNRQQP